MEEKSREQKIDDLLEQLVAARTINETERAGKELLSFLKKNKTSNTSSK